MLIFLQRPNLEEVITINHLVEMTVEEGVEEMEMINSIPTT